MSHRKYRIIAFSVLTVLTLVGCLAIVVLYNRRTDSGLAACRAMADMKTTTSNDSPMNSTDYKHLRSVFQNSKVDSIRRAGTTFVDVTWQVSQMRDGDPAQMLYLNQIVQSYTDLVTACADNGVQLPTLSDLSASASPEPKVSPSR